MKNGNEKTNEEGENENEQKKMKMKRGRKSIKSLPRKCI